MWTATASATAPCPAPIIPTASYFTRGSGHNDKAQYTEREDDYINNMDRLAHKFEVMRKHVPAPVVRHRRRREDRLRRRRHLRLRRARKLRPAQRRVRHRRQLPAPEGVSVHRATCWTSSAATTASTWWTRIATRQLLGLMRLEFDAGADRQTAQRALLRRPAARRAHRHRRNHPPGGQMSTTVTASAQEGQPHRAGGSEL